ncbi:YfiR family protein [Litoribacillus peritrichatus]|uniref:DUF4154 domain-containing protein n=1 Tax=Litoribacillus peritrichatus TaxID=718191 RepID=A0ABP7MB59_9GAMM
MKRFAVFFMALSLCMPVYCAEIVYQIKASYLYNFLQFVQLVGDPNDDAPQLKVCIVGENRFGTSIDALEGETTPQGVIRMSTITRYSSREKVSGCQVVYIVGTEKSFAQRVLADIDTTKVLTIGEFQSFTGMGGFIELFIENDSVRFRINSELAGHTQFKVAAQLLSLGVEDS